MIGAVACLAVMMGFAVFGSGPAMAPTALPASSDGAGQRFATASEASLPGTRNGSPFPEGAPVRVNRATAADPSRHCTLRVIGIDPRVPWTAELLAEFGPAEQRRVVRVPVDAHGVGRLPLPIGVVSLPQLTIGAEDPHYRLVGPHRRIGSAAAGDSIEVAVEPIIAIRGRVLGPNGNGWVARVQAFAVDAMGPLPAVLAATTAAPDGTYALRLPPDAQVLLVADCVPARGIVRVETGQAGGLLVALEEEADAGDPGQPEWLSEELLPASTWVVPVHGEANEAEDLLLGVPSTLTGRLMLASGQPLAGALVMAQPAGALERSLGDSMSWSPVYGAVRGSRVRTSVDGRFRFALAPGLAFLVRAIGDDPLLLAGEASAAVIAPGHLELVVPGELVGFAVTAAGEPVPGAALALGEHACRVGGDGRLRAMLPSGTMRVRAIDATCGMANVDLPAVGRPAVVELPLAKDGLAPVRLHLGGSYGVWYATFEWQPRPVGLGFTLMATPCGREDPFELWVPPGNYRLVVREHEHRPALVPLHFDVEVTAAGLTLTAEGSAGGQLLLDVLAADRTRPRGRFTLLQDGRDVTPSAMADDDWRPGSGAPGELLPGFANRLATVLPPGDYVLVVAVAGHAQAEQRVTIRAKQTTTAVVRLR
jgi:hypothetical protein